MAQHDLAINDELETGHSNFTEANADDLESPVKWEGLPDGVVKSAGRTMQILEYFEHIQRPSNIAEIVRVLGYPQTSASEILRSLRLLGYLHYDPKDRTYCPKSRVRFLGSWINTPVHGQDRLSRFVKMLNQEFGHTVFLSIRNDMCSQYIQVAQATTSLRLHLVPGQRRPLLKSLSGRTLLKDTRDAEISKLVRRANAETPAGEPLLRLEDVMQSISFLRKNNYLYTQESLVTPGAAVITMPMPKALFPEPTVLGVGGATNNMDPNKDEIISFMAKMIANEIMQ